MVDSFLNHQMDIELFDEMGAGSSAVLPMKISTRS